MDPLRFIDAYCERTDPSYWSEPVNAVTNAAFLIAHNGQNDLRRPKRPDQQDQACGQHERDALIAQDPRRPRRHGNHPDAANHCFRPRHRGPDDQHQSQPDRQRDILRIDQPVYFCLHLCDQRACSTLIS